MKALSRINEVQLVPGRPRNPGLGTSDTRIYFETNNPFSLNGRRWDTEAAVRVYWQTAKQGLRLVLADGEREERIGGVRGSKQGFDAFAITFGYDPDRAQRGIASLDEAKAFVESFRPWELFTHDQELSVEPHVKPLDG